MTEADRTADAELLRLVRQGSKAALGTLYRRYLPSVWRYVYTQVGGDEHVTEDVVSETFLSFRSYHILNRRPFATRKH